MSSPNYPCAACKFLRRRCTQECMFAPYFPPDQPQKFSTVHKIFGASNVTKILNELTPSQREDAVNSLAYEAEARLRDPVYGCVGLISILQHKLKQVQNDLMNARKELATYIFMQHQMQYNNVPPMLSEPRHNPHHESDEPQQLVVAAVAREQQEMTRSYEQQQHQQQEMIRFSSRGFNHNGEFEGGPRGYRQVSAVSMVSSTLALGTSANEAYGIQQGQQEQFFHQLQHRNQPKLLLQQQNQQEEGPIVGHS